MLGHPEYPAVPNVSHPLHTVWACSVTIRPVRDNQQETAESPLDPNWICGFVDGEGCFSVAIHRNPLVRRTRRMAIGSRLSGLAARAGTGEPWNASSAPSGAVRCVPKVPRNSVLVYSVSSLHDLEERIIPFFRAHPLHVKQADFDRFAEVVGAMLRKEHLEPAGFERIVRVAYAMNAVGKQRSRSLEEVLQGSSETIRQAPHRG